MHLHLLAALALPFITAVAASPDEQIILPNPNILAGNSIKLSMSPDLADLLTIHNEASIFYSYARETQMSRLFDDEHKPTTLLVPTNSAVMALPRKPHQDPAPVNKDIEITEDEYDERSRKNVANWVAAHIIPQSPISFNAERSYDTLKEGMSVSIKFVEGDASKPDWTRVQLNGNVSIVSKHEAANGVLYLIDTAIFG